MEPKQYNRLLVRLVALPVLSLAVLTLVLGYALERVEQSAGEVDRADQILAQANSLTKLMIDEETGLRGYLLTRDPLFLQPLREAGQKMDGQFATLFDLLKSRPKQTASLHAIQAEHQAWEQEAAQEIALAAGAREFMPNMLERKQKMDQLRGSWDDFVRRAENSRARRWATANHTNKLALLIVVLLSLLVAVLIAWITHRLFRALQAAYSRQIAEVKRRGEEAYAREQWLSTTLRSIGDAVIACDTEGRVEFLNSMAERLTGWPESDARGVSLHQVFPIFNEQTRAKVENPVDKVLRLGTVVGLANHTFLLRRDGTEIAIDDSGAPIRNTEGAMIGIVLVFRDISERRLTESALMRAEKLAAAGRMAATMAHEVNNPLEGLTNLVYLGQRSENLEEIRRLLAQAERELGRIAHITRQSLGFYRETTTAAYFSPAAVVQEVADFFAPRAQSQGVRLSVETVGNSRILGKSGELRQILSNLLANGLDACASGATIRITERPAINLRTFSDAGVRITVADSGPGIPPEHLGRIFEPFYTTKQDTGTGLGLWVCRELVEKHGGILRVRSSTAPSSSGTVFSIYLPEREKAATAVAGAEADPVPAILSHDSLSPALGAS